MDPTEITYEMVNKKLQEIILSRGKKGIDRQDQVEMLSYLATVAKGPYQKVRLHWLLLFTWSTGFLCSLHDTLKTSVEWTTPDMDTMSIVMMSFCCDDDIFIMQHFVERLAISLMTSSVRCAGGGPGACGVSSV